MMFQKSHTAKCFICKAYVQNKTYAVIIIACRLSAKPSHSGTLPLYANRGTYANKSSRQRAKAVILPDRQHVYIYWDIRAECDNLCLIFCNQTFNARHYFVITPTVILGAPDIIRRTQFYNIMYALKFCIKLIYIRYYQKCSVN